MITSPGGRDRAWCRAFDISLGILIAAVPLTYSFLAPNTSKVALLGAVVPVVALLWLWGGCGRAYRPLPQLAVPLLTLLVVAGLSLFQALNVKYGLQRLIVLLILFTLYLTVAYCARSDRQRTLVLYLVLTALVVSGLSLSGCLTGYTLVPSTPVGMMMRLFGNTNYGAAYLVTVIPLALALYVHASRQIDKVLYGAVLFLSMILMTLTMVRGAWVSILIGLLVVARVSFRGTGRSVSSGVAPKRAQLGAVFLIAFALVFAVALWPRCLPGFPGITERVMETLDPQADSLQIRLAFWEGTVRLIRDHLWTGVGIGNFALAFVPYRSPVIYRHPTVQAEHPHNEYLNVWAELGLFGVLAFAWLLLRVVRLVRDRLGCPGVSREVLAGTLGGVAATAGYAALFYVVHAPSAAMNLAILLGMLDGMDRDGAQKGRGEAVRLPVLLAGGLVAALVWFTYFLSPLVGEYYYGLAQREFRREVVGEGLSRLERSLTWNPHSYVTRYRRATALFLSERYAETIGEADEALRIHPNLEVAYWVKGSAYAKSGERVKAKEMFLQALAINPNYPHAVNNLGVLAAEEGRMAEAESLFLRAQAILGPTEVGPYLNLANLYETAGRVTDALRMYEAAADVHPTSGSTWYQVARLRAVAGDPRGAYAALARAIELEETWRARALQDRAFEALRQQDRQFRTLLRLE